MTGNDIKFHYFRGYESEQFAFYRIPKVLFTNDYFRDLSSDAKILYGLMLDRMSLSIKNHWIDEMDRVYIIFTLEQVMEYMNCGKDKGVKIMAELDSEKGIGLIERVKRGLGKPTLIYVKSFVIRESAEAEETIEESEGEGIETPALEEPKSEVLESRSPESGEAEVQSSEKPKSGVLEDRSPEFWKAEVQSSEKPKSGVLEDRSPEFWKAEVQSSEKPKSGVLENRSPDCGKNASNYTDINNTDYSKSNLINPLDESRQENRMDVMEIIRAYTELVKENIAYDTLIASCNTGERTYIDEIVALMVEIICIPREKVMIAGAEYPYQLVKGRLLKIDNSHIQYVLDCLNRNTTKIRNIKAYLLTSIFNAPTTISSYYRAEVNHDMYGTG